MIDKLNEQLKVNGVKPTFKKMNAQTSAKLNTRVWLSKVDDVFKRYFLKMIAGKK